MATGGRPVTVTGWPEGALQCGVRRYSLPGVRRKSSEKSDVSPLAAYQFRRFPKSTESIMMVQRLPSMPLTAIPSVLALF